MKLNKANVSHTYEIFQSLDIKFSMLKKDKEDEYTQVHTAIKCRDFLGDCVWSRKTKLLGSIYGFSYSFAKAPYELNQLCLSLTFPNKNSLQMFKENFKFINEKDTQAKVQQSSFFETDCPLSLIVIADKAWMSSVWKISLFTFYLKLISYKTPQDAQEPENIYLAIFTKEIEEKLLSFVATEEHEVLADDINTAHNFSGFVSIIKGQNKTMHQLLLGN